MGYIALLARAKQLQAENKKLEDESIGFAKDILVIQADNKRLRLLVECLEAQIKNQDLSKP